MTKSMTRVADQSTGKKNVLVSDPDGKLDSIFLNDSSSDAPQLLGNSMLVTPISPDYNQPL